MGLRVLGLQVGVQEGVRVLGFRVSVVDPIVFSRGHQGFKGFRVCRVLGFYRVLGV